MVEQPTHAEIAQGLKALEAKFDTMATKFDEMKDILEFQQAIRTGGKLVTWLAKVGGAIIALITIYKVWALSLVDLGGK